MRSKFIFKGIALSYFAASFLQANEQKDLALHEPMNQGHVMVESAKGALLSGLNLHQRGLEKGEIVSLLIGINYENTSSALSNCIRDIDHVLNLVLKPRLKVKDSSVIYMSDKRQGTPYYPTKSNILKQLRQFAGMLNETKIGYFHYSGHGSRVFDTSFDEADRYDEALVPVDYGRSGMILDDEMYSSFIKLLNPDVKLFVVTDCCHSGTILDLPYLWNESGRISKEHRLSEADIAALPTVVSLSGCKDTQTSADGGPLTVNNEGSGALTAAFLATIKKYNFNITYRQLLKNVNDLLEANGFTQRPQLSSTKILDLDLKILGLSRELVAAE
jgi:hypothetical protein